MQRRLATTAATGVLLALIVGVASAGELERAIDRVEDGRIRFSFPTREGVWGDGHSVMTTDEKEPDWDCDCQEGPGRVQLTLRDGHIRTVKFRVGGTWRTPRSGDVDLGELDARAVSKALLDLAVREGVDDLVFAATVTQGFDDWHRVLAIARDRRVDEDVRQQCVFWLGQQASGVATRGLEAIVDDEDEDLQLREQAMFWLGQVDDPRVLDFFEEVLFEREG